VLRISGTENQVKNASRVTFTKKFYTKKGRSAPAHLEFPLSGLTLVHLGANQPSTSASGPVTPSKFPALPVLEEGTGRNTGMGFSL
jgi:hypothetical protein